MTRVLAHCAIMLALLDLTVVIKTIQKYTPFGAEDALERFLSRATIEDITKANGHATSFTVMLYVAAIIGQMP